MRKKNSVLHYFVLGIILFVIIQSAFMIGGMFIEKGMDIPITGIPSAIGITVVLIISFILAKKNEYVLLGSFALAFLSPLILFLVILFNAMEFTTPHIYYSLGYLCLVVFGVWIYYIRKIIKQSF
jgi:hypothetical protein